MIKNYFLILLSSLLFSSCDSSLSHEEYLEQCPYDLVSSSGTYYLDVPVEMVPHQVTYRIGDTLTCRMMFSDSLYDHNRRTKFKIDNFPFQPIYNFYRIQDSLWYSGFLENEVIIDEKYNPRSVSGSQFSVDVRGFTIHEVGVYEYELQIVLSTPGTHFIFISDWSDGISQEDIDDGLFPEYIIDFDDSCPNPKFQVFNTIQGDSQYENFLDELLFLDKEIYSDQLTSDLKIDNMPFLGWGRFDVDTRGLYGFEVLE